MSYRFPCEGHEVVIEEVQDDDHLSFAVSIDGKRVCEKQHTEAEARRFAILSLRKLS